MNELKHYVFKERVITDRKEHAGHHIIRIYSMIDGVDGMGQLYLHMVWFSIQVNQILFQIPKSLSIIKQRDGYLVICIHNNNIENSKSKTVYE